MEHQDQTERDRQARDIFLRAAEIHSPEAQAAYLEGACQRDASLRSRVEALLENHRQDSFLENAAVDPRPTIRVEPALTESPGTKIGRYKLLQQIGEGGMGVVYMAEQEEPVRRRIALKIIKLGMDTRQVVARFEAERQALAMMDHPNIAKVLDGGTTESGRPYFVMELVQGVPIIEFCDKSKLPAKERLKLFIQVCQAVQSAHQKGIIHRDLKPSNILVTLHHGEPMPKVIDFGIAKATNQKLTEKTLFTNYATMIGTPAYMSPEQAEMTSMDVDTRTDIYSLGVLLYELLTGSTPFPEKRLRSMGYGEMQRVIADEEPERPSTRLSTLADEQKTTVAKNRGEDLAALNTLLRGDLDWIVMKCLEKDRTRRYETANGLAADLKRHLDNEPVVARPPSQLYRFQKAYRRNRIAFTAAACVLASLIIALGFIWAAARREGRARVHESIQRNLAEQQRQRAEASGQNAREAQAQEALMRQQAEHERSLAEASLYAAHMNLAQQELALGNLGVAIELLDRHRPRKGFPDRRGWEWRYLWAQCRKDENQTLGTHQERVTGVAFSPDGKLAATADAPDAGTIFGSKVVLWDWESKRPLGAALTDNAAGAVAFSPDGRFLAFSTLRQGVKLVEVSTRAQVAEFPGDQEFWNSALAFSGDSRLIAVGNNSGLIEVFDVLTARKAASLRGHLRGVCSVAFLPDGKRLVSGAWDKQVRLWEVPTGKPLVTWTNHTACVHGVAVSPDGRKIATASRDLSIRVWDAATYAELGATVTRETAWTSSIAFSPDGKTIACGGSDHTVRIWDAETLKELRVLRGSRDEVFAVAFSPDGKTLLSGAKDGEVKIWSTTAKQDETRFLPTTGDWKSSRLSANGKWLIQAGADQGYQIIETTGLRVVARRDFPLGMGKAAGGTALAPDGVKLAVGTEEGTVEILDIVTGRHLATLRQGKTRVGSLRFSRDGRTIASSDGVQAIFWDANSFAKLATLDHSARYTSGWGGITLWDHGRRVVTRCEDGRLELLDEAGRGSLRIWKAHRGVIMDAAFSPDGRLLASAGADARLTLWDGQTQQGTLVGRALNAFWSVNFDEPGSRLVAGAGEGLIRIYNPSGPHLLATLSGHNCCVSAVVFLPDGNTLASLGEDGLRIWRAPSWEAIAAIEAREHSRLNQP